MGRRQYTNETSDPHTNPYYTAVGCTLIPAVIHMLM